MLSHSVHTNSDRLSTNGSQFSIYKFPSPIVTACSQSQKLFALMICYFFDTAHHPGSCSFKTVLLVKFLSTLKSKIIMLTPILWIRKFMQKVHIIFPASEQLKHNVNPGSLAPKSKILIALLLGCSLARSHKERIF